MSKQKDVLIYKVLRVVSVLNPILFVSTVIACFLGNRFINMGEYDILILMAIACCYIIPAGMCLVEMARSTWILTKERVDIVGLAKHLSVVSFQVFVQSAVLLLGVVILESIYKFHIALDALLAVFLVVLIGIIIGGSLNVFIKRILLAGNVSDVHALNRRKSIRRSLMITGLFYSILILVVLFFMFIEHMVLTGVM